jgi:hypothetical protein
MHSKYYSISTVDSWEKKIIYLISPFYAPFNSQSAMQDQFHLHK